MLKKKKRLLIIPVLCCICAGLVTVLAQGETIRIEDTQFQLIADNPSSVTVRDTSDATVPGGTSYKNTYAPMSSPYSLKAEFNVAESGLYNLSAVTYMNGVATYLSEYSIMLNGTVYTKAQIGDGSAFTSVTPESYNASLWRKYTTSVYLKAGTNTIIFTPTSGRVANVGLDPEYLFAIDYVEITGGVSATVKTEFETLTGVGTESNASCSGGVRGYTLVQGETGNFDITLNAPVDGMYSFEFSASPPNTSANYESKYSITQNSETLSLTAKSKEYYSDIYEADVWLKKGANTITLKMQKRGADNYCVVYGDYYQITLKEAAENFIIEGENYSSSNFTPNVSPAVGISNEKILVCNQNYSGNPCYIEYVFQADRTGWYEIISRNTKFGEAWTTDFSVSVNDGEIAEPAKYAPILRSHTEYTADKNLIKEYSLGTFYLNAGSNKMRIYLNADDKTSSNVYVTFIDCFKVRGVTKANQIIRNDSCNVYEEGSDVVIPLRYVSDSVGEKTYTYTLTDFYGSASNGSVTVKSEEADSKINLGKLSCGWYELEILDGSETISSLKLSVVKPYAERYKGETPFAADFASSILKNTDEHDKQIKAAKLAGVQWMRERYSWKGLQAIENTAIDFNKINSSLKTFHENGIKVTTILYDLPEWTSEDELLDIYNFIKNATEKTDVDIWEILNESDGGKNSPADSYSAFYKAAALGNAASSKPAMTSSAAQCMSPDAFYNRLLLKNDLMYFSDIYNYHIHTNLKDDKISKINTHDIRSHIDASSDNGDRPFWITEAGTYMPVDAEGNVTESQRKWQAQYCVTSTVESLACGTQKHFWFIFPKYEEQGQELGSFDADLNPQPVYQAYATMTYMLGKGEYKGELNIDGVYGHVFNDGTRDIAVIWADNSGNIALQTSADVKITDMMGKESTLTCSGNSVSVPVGVNPVYVPLTDINVSYQEKTFEQSIGVVPEFTAADKIVMQQYFSGQGGADARMGYQITNGETATMTVKLTNFNDTAKTVRLFGSLYGYDVIPENSSVTVPSMGSTSVTVTLRPNGETILGEQLNLAFNCEVDGLVSSPSVSNVIVQGGTISSDLQISGFSTASNWKKFSGDSGASITSSADGIHFSYDFTGENRWAFPYINITNQNVIKNYDGISFRAKADSGSKNGGYYNINVVMNDGSAYNLGTITGYLLKEEWIYVKATWDTFQLYENPNGLPEDTKLDPSNIKAIRFGGNFYQDVVGFTLGDIGFIKANGSGINILSACIAPECVKVQVVNNQHNFGTYELVAAVYDEGGNLVRVSTKAVENKEPINTYDVTVKGTKNGDCVKLFAWDGLTSLRPVDAPVIVK